MVREQMVKFEVKLNGHPKFHIPGKWFACLLKEANYICERKKNSA